MSKAGQQSSPRSSPRSTSRDDAPAAAPARRWPDHERRQRCVDEAIQRLVGATSIECWRMGAPILSELCMPDPARSLEDLGEPDALGVWMRTRVLLRGEATENAGMRCAGGVADSRAVLACMLRCAAVQLVTER